MRFSEFIRRSLSESDQTPSAKRQISVWVVLVYSAIIISSFAFKLPVSDQVVHMADLLLTSGLGTYVIGRFAENKKSTTPTDSDPTVL